MRAVSTVRDEGGRAGMTTTDAQRAGALRIAARIALCAAVLWSGQPSAAEAFFLGRRAPEIVPALPAGHPLSADEITLQNSAVRLRGGAKFGVGLTGIAGEIHDDQMALSGFCEAAQRVMNTDEARIEGVAANVHAYAPRDDADARSRHDLNRAFIGRTLTAFARKLEVYRRVLAQWPDPRGDAALGSVAQMRHMAIGCAPDIASGLNGYFGGGAPYK
jgi:hypothetical protein